MWRWCAYRSSQNALKVLLNDVPWMGTKVSTAASLNLSKLLPTLAGESAPLPWKRSQYIIDNFVSPRTFASGAESEAKIEEHGTSVPLEEGGTSGTLGSSALVPQAEHVEQGKYRDVETTLFNIDRVPIGKVVLPGDVFDVPIRIDILHRVIRWQRANRQQGTHKTKTRAEVRGGGRKPWRQKGTGRARQGSIRAPHFRGGGVAHGPVPRSHAHGLPKRVRRLGLKCALSAKAWERRLIIVDSIKPTVPKTKVMLGHIKELLEGAPRISALMMDSCMDGDDGGKEARLATGNIPWLDVFPVVKANVYSIIQRDFLVLTQPALELIVNRMRRPIKPNSNTP